jgi:hypothetical protein
VVIIPGIGCEIDFSKELLLMVLELSDHFVSLFCFDVVFDFGGEVEIIFGAVGSEKHSCDAKKLELEVEQMTLLLERPGRGKQRSNHGSATISVPQCGEAGVE